MTAPAETIAIDELAREIAGAWRKGIEAILEVSQLMFEAREVLGDDDWAALVVILPFGPAHARRLVRIGQCEWLRTHVCALPSDIEALDKIAALSTERRAELMGADIIHPGMARGDLDTLVKQEARAAKERDLGAATRTANSALAAGFGGGAGENRRYNVLYVDPPWRFEPYSRTTGLNKAADNHYPTLNGQQIGALSVENLVASDAVLFLWATVPLLEAAHEVMATWGFRYKSQFVWVKDRAGTGYWNRNRHEILLVGTRGAIPCPAPGTQVDSVLKTGADEVLAHSQKPQAARTMIEAYFPSVPKIELFARAPVAPGWDLWGNEAPELEPGA